MRESKFLETLDQGLKFLNAEIKNKTIKTLSGEKAFKLYDTFGFPFDLTEIILKEKDIAVDLEGFENEMLKSKERSKKSWKSTSAIDNKVFYEVLQDYGPTTFLGFEQLSSKSKLLKIISLDNNQDMLFFDTTPFYAESGGQVGDTGTIHGKQVIDVIKPIAELHGHVINSNHQLKVGSEYSLQINEVNRDSIAKNHSATHLLQAALIKTLGVHVRQAGSLVNANKLRFDFTHTNALSQSEIDSVEKLVNDKISEELEVTPRVMKKNDALKSGAMAVFGEKYDDEVRVLKMGNFSTELCGGTHVNNTREISLFKITTETSLSSGVRRIEAITSKQAVTYLNECARIVAKLQENLNTSENEILSKVSNLRLTSRKQEKRAPNSKTKYKP